MHIIDVFKFKDDGEAVKMCAYYGTDKDRLI